MGERVKRKKATGFGLPNFSPTEEPNGDVKMELRSTVIDKWSSPTPPANTVRHGQELAPPPCSSSSPRRTSWGVLIVVSRRRNRLHRYGHRRRRARPPTLPHRGAAGQEGWLSRIAHGHGRRALGVDALGVLLVTLRLVPTSVLLVVFPAER
jgi:hypothetical protein